MAAGSNQVRAGRAYVELNTKDNLAAGLKAAGKKFLGFAKFIGVASLAIGSSAIAGATAAIGAFSHMGSEMNDLAARTGMTVEGLSELKFAAEQSGASMDDVEIAARKMSKTIADAAGGSKEATDALAKLGTNAAELQQLSPDEQFRKLSRSLAGIQDPAQRASLAVALFGKSGTVLIPMAQDIDALTARARELGIVMRDSDARAADKFGDKLGELWAVVKSGVFLIGAALAPAMQSFVDGVVRGGVSIINTIKENRANITAWVNSIAKAAAWVGSRFLDLAKTADDALGGALTALTSGEFEIAGKLVVTQLKEAWLGLKSFMEDLWSGIGNIMVSAMIRAAADIEKIWANLKIEFRKLTNTLGEQITRERLLANVKTAASNLSVAQKGGDKAKIKAAADAALEASQKLKDFENQMEKGGANDKALKDEIDAIEKEKDAKLQALAQIADKTDQTQKQQLGEEVANLEKQGDALRKQAAKNREDKKRAAAVDSQLEDYFGQGRMLNPDVTDPNDIAGAVTDASKKVFASKGTFNAAALQSLQGGKEDEIAKNTKDMAKDIHTVVTKGGKFVYQA